VKIWTGLFVAFALLLSDAALAEDTTSFRFGVPTPLEDPSGKAMVPFYRSLRKTEKGLTKTRIIQFGASHTAADLMTARMRNRLQKRFGDGGLGFVMPARPYRHYRHQHVLFEGPKAKRSRWHWDFVRRRRNHLSDRVYGLAGMSITAYARKQWAVMQTYRPGRFRRSVSQLEIYYAPSSRGGDLNLTVDGKRFRRIRTRGKKSVGIYSLKLTDRPHRFHLRPRGNGKVRLYGAVLERRRAGVVLDTIGINGARAESMLKWNFTIWKKLVRRRNPALIILAYGTNEAGDTGQPISLYRQALTKVIRRVRLAAPKASCILFGPTDRPFVHRETKEDDNVLFTHRKRTDLIIETQRKVAFKYGCAFWDAVATTGGNLSIINWANAEPKLAWTDYVHFTTRGYRLMADLFLDAIMADYQQRKRR
jgi:lysophospholipase L1-like esterase